MEKPTETNENDACLDFALVVLNKKKKIGLSTLISFLDKKTNTITLKTLKSTLNIHSLDYLIGFGNHLNIILPSSHFGDVTITRGDLEELFDKYIIMVETIIKI